MHARARNRFVHVEQRLTLAEAINQDVHRAAVKSMRAQPQQVVQQTRDFGVHHTDVLRAHRHVHTQQLFDGQAVGVLVGHHGHIVQPVHVRQGLDVGLAFGKLFSRTVQQPDVRVGTLDDLAIKLQHQAQNAMGSRMLWPEIERVVFDFSHVFLTAY